MFGNESAKSFVMREMARDVLGRKASILTPRRKVCVHVKSTQLMGLLSPIVQYDGCSYQKAAHSMLHVDIVRKRRDRYRHYGIAAKVGTLGRVNPVRLDFD